MLESQNKLVEAQRLRMRTTYDLEMMQQMGFCNGIENYSSHIDGRARGTAPHCLIDYFPDDFLLVIDESHVTVPQIGAMYEGDMSRKRNLVDHGFRLPSAMDNRPLKWDEFQDRVGQTVYLSATPGKYELGKADGFVQQIIRPTGLIDPEVIVKPTKGQIDDLLGEIRTRTAKNERVLVTTLTKRMAEDLTDYLLGHGVKVEYLHSDVDTLRRVELLRELRMGVFDVLVGINLLREGLDLPEVSLVSILDADKEGFLRSSTSLIQTIGRAARNVSGQVHMYADRSPTRWRTRSTRPTGAGPSRSPTTRKKASTRSRCGRRSPTSRTRSPRRTPTPANCWPAAGKARGKGKGSAKVRADGLAAAPAEDLVGLIEQLTEQMHAAAGELQFELAARLRDEVGELKKELRQMQSAGHA